MRKPKAKPRRTRKHARRRPAGRRADFFISYSRADVRRAQWIAQQLEENGLSTVMQALDFRPGSDFVLQMHRAVRDSKRTIAVLSPDYLRSKYAEKEWAAILAQDPSGMTGRLVPVRVRKCSPTGLLASIAYIDLVGLSGGAALRELLEGIRTTRPRTSPLPPSPAETALPRLWNIPFNRNPNFAGRDELLARLRCNLASGLAGTNVQVISGLGGVGKTQLAVEYAYRHSRDYRLVRWIRTDEPATLVADYASLAAELGLPTASDRNQQQNLTSVRKWLDQNSGWLLIFDNAEAPSAVRELLPQAATGHVLITSRNPNWRGCAATLKLSLLDPDDAAGFLARRTAQADRDAAARIAEELGFLPLALEQAGAYIDANAVLLSDYLKLFRERRRLLWAREKEPAGYQGKVTTTWNLSIERVRQDCPAASDLLYFASFLAPDAIPLPLFRLGANLLPARLAECIGDDLQMNDTLGALRRYSLVEGSAGTFAVHRLVQAVTRESLTETECRRWAGRALKVTLASLPENAQSPGNWPVLRRLVPHGMVVLAHAESVGVVAQQQARLGKLLAVYLTDQAQFAQAEPLLRRALALTRGLPRPDTLEVADQLNHLAILLRRRGRYSDAEKLYRETLALREQERDPEHPDVVQVFSNLGTLYYEWGKYGKADPALRRALAIREKTLGEHDLGVAATANILGAVCYRRGRYFEAESLYRRALAIREKTLGPDHPDVSTSLNNVALVYRVQKRYAEAEPLLRRALTIREQTLGPEHPGVAQILNNLALVTRLRGDCDEAERLYRRALAIDEKAFGPEHQEVAQSLTNLALLLCECRKTTEAEAMLRRSLRILEPACGPDHPLIAKCLAGLGTARACEKCYDEAEQLLARALKMRRELLTDKHPDVTETRRELAEVRKLKKRKPAARKRRTTKPRARRP